MFTQTIESLDIEQALGMVISPAQEALEVSEIDPATALAFTFIAVHGTGGDIEKMADMFENYKGDDPRVLKYRTYFNTSMMSMLQEILNVV